MANFDSGVYGYVYAEATVQVAFPVDKNGKSAIMYFNVKRNDKASPAKPA